MPITQLPSMFTKRLLFISITLFVVSLMLNAYRLEHAPENSGLTVFLEGATGGFLIYGIANYWIANPLLIYAWIKCTHYPLHSLVASVIASFIALAFAFIKQMPVTEAPRYDVITKLDWGYWLWLGSIVTMACGNGWLKLRSKLF